MARVLALTPEEQAKRARLDGNEIRRVMRAGNASNAWMRTWVEVAYQHPAAFREVAQAALGEGSWIDSDDPGKGVDLHHQVVGRHLGRERPALKTLESGQVVSLSFDELHERARNLAAGWSRLGIKPGMSLGLILPLGQDYAVTLLAALRLGLVITVIPCFGVTYVRNRLGVAPPDAVVCTVRHASTAREFGVQVLPLLSRKSDDAPRAHRYSWKEPVFRAYPLFGSAAVVPVPVTTSAILFGALCDGTVLFALDHDDVLAAPGFHSLAVQPCMLLASLVMGASWAEVSVDECQAKPSLLKELGVTVLGVTPTLRDALMARTDELSGCVRTWFRNLTDVFEPRRWDDWGERLASQGAAGLNTAFSTTAGGGFLFGPVERGAPTLQVWPIPGRDWELRDAVSGTMPSPETGVLTMLAEKKPLLGLPRLILTRQEGEYLFGGTLDVGPGSRSYPATEVCELVASCPSVRHVSVVITPGRAVNSARVTLLVFTVCEDWRGESPTLTAGELTTMIARELSVDVCPDTIELFALSARLGKDGVDHDWCRSNYLDGTLTQRSRREVFSLLAQLRSLVEASAETEPKRGEE